MRLVWLCGLTSLLLIIGLACYLAPLQPSVVVLQLSFSPRAFGEVIHTWSPEQLELYRNHFPFDFALLLSYGAFGYLLVTRTHFFSGNFNKRMGFAKWCLPLGAACDALENILHLWLTAVPRFGVPVVYATSASLSLLKWILLVAFGCLVACALARTEV